MKSIHKILYICSLLTLINGCTSMGSLTTTRSSPEASLTEHPNILFDDFSYSTRDEMAANGWIIRTQAGWPGIPGATFRAGNVSFIDDTVIAGNRILRMTSSTDGTSANTFQTQICHQRKYFEGTYAARVYFTNDPVAGPDGDQVVETFYSITPYEEALNPDYSELDFEYLPNGGWGFNPMTLMFTTWETVRIEPWLADNTSNSKIEDMAGWSTLVLQVGAGKARYFVSGTLVAEHSGNYYPDSPMSINFNLWFINAGLINDRDMRSYQEDIDWVYHAAGVILTPEQVNKKVRALREEGIGFMDTVPAQSPLLDSPCDL